MKKVIFLVLTAALMGGCSSEPPTPPPVPPPTAEPGLRFTAPPEKGKPPRKRRNRAATKNFTPETQIMR